VTKTQDQNDKNKTNLDTKKAAIKKDQSTNNILRNRSSSTTLTHKTPTNQHPLIHHTTSSTTDNKAERNKGSVSTEKYFWSAVVTGAFANTTGTIRDTFGLSNSENCEELRVIFNEGCNWMEDKDNYRKTLQILSKAYKAKKKHREICGIFEHLQKYFDCKKQSVDIMVLSFSTLLYSTTEEHYPKRR
jgi:hypothetical protein